MTMYRAIITRTSVERMLVDVRAEDQEAAERKLAQFVKDNGTAVKGLEIVQTYAADPRPRIHEQVTSILRDAAEVV